jgi:hypothetical protein
MTANHTIQFGNSSLSITITDSPHEIEYLFKGDVDEHFRHKDVPRVKKDSIVFTLDGVTNFNSCGIREWIYLVRDIGELGRLRFRKCSVAMIESINMVPDTLGKGQIESLLAPYFCATPGCGEMTRLLEMTTHRDHISRKSAPSLSCEKCGKPLEFDALEESYFLFVDALGNAR